MSSAKKTDSESVSNTSDEKSISDSLNEISITTEKSNSSRTPNNETKVASSKTANAKTTAAEFREALKKKLGEVSDNTQSELEELSENGNNILPDYDDKDSVKIGSKTVTFRASVDKYKTVSKKIASKSVDTLVSTSEYKKSDEKTKVNMINKTYELSSELAKAQLDKSYELTGEAAEFKKTARNFGDVPGFVLKQFGMA